MPVKIAAALVTRSACQRDQPENSSGARATGSTVTVGVTGSSIATAGRGTGSSEVSQSHSSAKCPGLLPARAGHWNPPESGALPQESGRRARAAGQGGRAPGPAGGGWNRLVTRSGSNVTRGQGLYPARAGPGRHGPVGWRLSL